MVLIQRIYLLIGIPIILLLVASLLGASIIWQANQQTQVLINEIVVKQHILMLIYSEAGYGAGIHHYKNLILRRDIKYLRPAIDGLTTAIAQCDRYLSLNNLTPLETEAINEIKKVLSIYPKNALIVQVLITQGKSTTEIDRKLRVDSRAAVSKSNELKSYLESKRITYIQKFADTQLTFFILLGILFLIILILSILLTNAVKIRIEKIIENAVEMAREVASGNYKPKVDPEITNEVGSLFRDIQSMAESIRHKVEQLQTRNSDLEQFTFIAAHDLREPVNKINNYADEILHEEMTLSDISKKHLERILENTARLSITLRDLLFYADLTSTDLHLSQIDLNEALAKAKSELENLMKPKKATIVSDPLPMLSGQVEHFKKLFTIILSNSLKFAKPDIPPVITIKVKDQSDSHLISITDNGVGFNQNLADEIIKPFIKLQAKTKNSGSGIGLAVATRLLQLYGSQLQIRSVPGQGTTVTFSLAKSSE